MKTKFVASWRSFYSFMDQLHQNLYFDCRGSETLVLGVSRVWGALKTLCQMCVCLLENEIESTGQAGAEDPL